MQVDKTEADLAALRKRGAGLGAELARLARAQGAAETAAATAAANGRDLVRMDAWARFCGIGATG